MLGSGRRSVVVHGEAHPAAPPPLRPRDENGEDHDDESHADPDRESDPEPHGTTS